MMNNKLKVVLPAAVAMLTSLIVLGWWFGIRDSSPSLTYVTSAFKGYESIESITEDSDAVGIGTIKGIIGSTVHKLNNPAPRTIPDSHLERPYVFYEVEVHETLKGTPGDTIILLRTDHTRQWNEDAKPLEAGGQVLLFLASRAGSTGLGEFGDLKNLYVTLSHDHGVFEISGDTAVPRTPYFKAEKGEDGNRIEAFTLAEIRAKTGN